MPPDEPSLEARRGRGGDDRRSEAAAQIGAQLLEITAETTSAPMM